MRSAELEAWALAVARRAIAREPSEADSRVELKRAWPAPDVHAARQLAGHANAARGEPVMWIIGIHERSGIVEAAEDRELSNWLSSLRGRFDGSAPTLLQHVVTRVGDQLVPVVALLFETDRAPYVVRVESCGPVTREVPWREGGALRSATHEDLIRLLVPAVQTPQVELLWFRVDARQPAKTGGAKPPSQRWDVEADIYLTNRSRDLLTIPFHRCELQIRQGDSEPIVRSTVLRLAAPTMLRRSEALAGLTSLPDSATVESTRDEVHVHGSGRVVLTGQYVTEPGLFDPGRALTVSLQCWPVGADRPFDIAIELAPDSEAGEAAGLWRWAASNYRRRQPGQP